MIKQLVVVPIDVDELTERDIKSGMTLARRAFLYVEDRITKKTDQFAVPAEGRSINLDPPRKPADIYLKAHVNMYDRQTEDLYFTAEGPHVLVPDAAGTVKLSIAHRGPEMVFQGPNIVFRVKQIPRS